ncbi:MAG: BtpA/SgcQ family protein [Candidatus Sedimenticola sp. PURPLELP]
MTTNLFARLNDSNTPVIGMVHLAPLPGSPRYDANLNWVQERALKDAQILAQGGVDAMIIENFGDVPFYPGRVPQHVVAHMTAIAALIRQQTDLPLGINCLRNDGLSALAVAHAVGAEFIRVNVLTGARVADQGIIQGIAHELLRERDLLRARGIHIMADVDVKHSSALGERRPLAEDVMDLVRRGMADGVVVSGGGTGLPTDITQVEEVKAVVGDVPVFVGSGVNETTAKEFSRVADGMIVGTNTKREGIASNPVELERVQALMSALD